MKLLENKTVVITGASRGIGRGIAVVLAKHGANIAFTYSKSVDAAISLSEEIAKLSVNVKDIKVMLKALKILKNLLIK